MTYPDAYPGDDPLEGLNPTDEERLAYYRALDEVEAEEAGIPYEAGSGDDDGEDPSGPWRDGLGQLEAAGAALDEHYALDGQRVAEDIVAGLDRRPSSEAILARAMPRIAAQTYTQDAWWRGDPDAAARDQLGRYQAACGPLDDLGRCASRYHEQGCHVIIEESAATGSAEAAEAWRDTLNSRTPYGGISTGTLGLANEPVPGDGTDVWSELLEAPAGPADPRLHQRVLHHMGLGEQLPPETRPDYPDTVVLRAELGI